MNRREIIEKVIYRANKLVGTPFVHQGRNKSGIDCIGLVVDIAKYLGQEIDDTKRYGPEGNGKLLLEKCRQHGDEIPIKKYGPGDVVLLSWLRDKEKPHHAGVVVSSYDGLYFLVHGNKKVGKIVKHILTIDYHQRITHAFRFRGPG